MPGRGMPRPVATSPRSSRAGALLLLGDQHVPAPERVLLPADGPAEPGLVGGDVEADVLAVQRVAHLGAQGVAGAEAAGQQAERLTGGERARPRAARRRVVLADQLVAALAGVAGAAHDDRRRRRRSASTNDM